MISVMVRVKKAFEAEEDLVLKYKDMMESNSRAQLGHVAHA
jgi:uncharacterized glyoxalase superfamily protein PhnB